MATNSEGLLIFQLPRVIAFLFSVLTTRGKVRPESEKEDIGRPKSQPPAGSQHGFQEPHHLPQMKTNTATCDPSLFSGNRDKVQRTAELGGREPACRWPYLLTGRLPELSSQPGLLSALSVQAAWAPTGSVVQLTQLAGHPGLRQAAETQPRGSETEALAPRRAEASFLRWPSPALLHPALFARSRGSHSLALPCRYLEAGSRPCRGLWTVGQEINNFWIIIIIITGGIY